jgi:dihydrofolate reductase
MEVIRMKKKIVAIAAITIDGKIARNQGHFTDWTSPEDKIFLRGFLNTCDAVVVGNNTYKTAEAPLSKRNCIVFTRDVETIEQVRENLLLCNPSNVPIKGVLEPYRMIALLGGTQTYSYFLQRNLIDELYLTVEPIVFGDGLSLFKCENDTLAFRFVSVEKLNERGALLLHYQRA